MRNKNCSSPKKVPLYKLSPVKFVIHISKNVAWPLIYQNFFVEGSGVGSSMIEAVKIVVWNCFFGNEIILFLEKQIVVDFFPFNLWSAHLQLRWYGLCSIFPNVDKLASNKHWNTILWDAILICGEIKIEKDQISHV